MATQPLVVIVGETASGKSALAMQLAKKFNGEIVCADSRTVYKDMDIGTAKPSQQDQEEVKHHLLNVVKPDQKFNVAQFKKLANKAIDDINARGKLAIMVGGSGLYVDSVIFDYQFSPAGSLKDQKNPRHLKDSQTHGGLRPNTLLIGLKLDAENLQKRITKRVEEMFGSGLVDEAKVLGKKYGWEIDPMQTPGYKALRQFLNGQVDEQKAKELFIRSDLQLAKKQRTWFKRNPSIQWLNDPSQSVDIVTTFLNKKQ